MRCDHSFDSRNDPFRRKFITITSNITLLTDDVGAGEVAGGEGGDGDYDGVGDTGDGEEESLELGGGDLGEGGETTSN